MVISSLLYPLEQYSARVSVKIYALRSSVEGDSVADAYLIRQQPEFDSASACRIHYPVIYSVISGQGDG